MYEEQFMLLYFSSALGEKTASLLPGVFHKGGSSAQC